MNDTLALVTIQQGNERELLCHAFPAGSEVEATCWAMDKVVEMRNRFDPYKGEIRMSIRLHQSDAQTESQQYAF